MRQETEALPDFEPDRKMVRSLPEFTLLFCGSKLVFSLILSLSHVGSVKDQTWPLRASVLW